jgi:hypothetical protein
MATPVFKFQHPDLPSEDLYFIHNTFFELPETIPMDLTTFIWYHLETGSALDGFFYCWDNLNKFHTTLNDETFDTYFDENQKQQLYDDALFGLSLRVAQINRRKSINLKYFIDYKIYETQDISDYAKPYIIHEYPGWDIDVSFFYSHHYFIEFIFNNYSDKLDEKDSYKHDKEIILSLTKINGLGLFYASDELKKDKKLFHEALEKDFRALHFADDSFKKDRELLLNLLGPNEWAFLFAHQSLKKDRNFVLEAVKSNFMVLEFVDKCFQNDREIILASTWDDGLLEFFRESSFKYVSNSLKRDRELVLEVITHDNVTPSRFKFIDISLRNDKKIVLQAVKHNGYSLKYASDLLKSDEEIVLEAIKNNPFALKFACKSLKSNRKFALEAVKNNGGTLEYFGEDFKKDREIVIEAVKKFDRAFQYASDELKSDRKFVLEVVRNNGCALNFIDESLQKDKEIVVEAIKNDGNTIYFVAESFQKDKEIIFQALKSGFRIDRDFYMNLDAILKNDKAIALATFQNCHVRIPIDFPNHFLNDKQFILEAIEKLPRLIYYLNPEFKKDPEVVLQVVKNQGRFLKYADSSLKTNLEIVKVAIKNNGLALEFVDESLKKDNNIVLEAVRNNPLALEFADESLKKDSKIVLEAIKNNGLALEFADESLKKDYKIALEAIKNNGLALEFANESLKKDSKIVLEAFRNNTKVINFISDGLWCDKMFVLEAIKIRYWALQYASDSLKNDREIAVEAINKDGFALEYVSDSLKSDLDIVLQAIKIDSQAIQFADENLDIVQGAIAKNREILLSFFKEQIEGIERHEYSARKNIEYDYDSIYEENPFYVLDFEVRNILEDLLEFATDGYDYDNKYIIEEYCPFLYKYIKKDKDFILNIYQLWPHYLMQFNILYKLAPIELLQNKGFLIEIFKLKIKGAQVWSWIHVPNHFWNDKEFVQLAINQDVMALQFANEIYKKDKGIVIEALKSSENAIQFVDDSLKEDEDVKALISFKPNEIKKSEEDNLLI